MKRSLCASNQKCNTAHYNYLPSQIKWRIFICKLGVFRNGWEFKEPAQPFSLQVGGLYIDRDIDSGARVGSHCSCVQAVCFAMLKRQLILCALYSLRQNCFWKYVTIITGYVFEAAYVVKSFWLLITKIRFQIHGP